MTGLDRDTNEMIEGLATWRWLRVCIEGCVAQQASTVFMLPRVIYDQIRSFATSCAELLVGSGTSDNSLAVAPPWWIADRVD